MKEIFTTLSKLLLVCSITLMHIYANHQPSLAEQAQHLLQEEKSKLLALTSDDNMSLLAIEEMAISNLYHTCAHTNDDLTSPLYMRLRPWLYIATERNIFKPDETIVCKDAEISNTTILRLAVQHNDVQMVTYLINKGAHPRRANHFNRGQSLWSACTNPEIAEILLAAGLTADKYHTQLLHDTIIRESCAQDAPMTQFFLQHGVRARDTFKGIPLLVTLAEQCNRNDYQSSTGIKIAQMLIAAGTRPQDTMLSYLDYSNARDITAKHPTCKPCEELAQFFDQHGIQETIKPSFSRLAIHGCDIEQARKVAELTREKQQPFNLSDLVQAKAYARDMNMRFLFGEERCFAFADLMEELLKEAREKI